MSASQPTNPASLEPEPIATLDELRTHLQWAMELEHATIPPYLTAWRSIPPGTNQRVAKLIRSVLIEEMLHLALAANLLNAVGGIPQLTYDGFVLAYPARLPHSSVDFLVSIEALSPDAVETFLAIEYPTPDGATPQPDQYNSIGRFYAAIADGIELLCSEKGEEHVFVGDPTRQVRASDYYGAGTLVKVTDKTSAERAIAEIIHQGEGAPGSIFDDDASIFGNEGLELAHFYRFQQIAKLHFYTTFDTPATGPTGPPLVVDYQSIFPIRANTRVSDYASDSEIHHSLERFSASYGQLLAALENTFKGQPTNFATAVSWMFTLQDQALALMRTPDTVDRGNVGVAFEPRFFARTK